MLKTDKKLKALIPPLMENEFKSLRQSILEHGCREAIIAWNGFIADGHHRHQICTDCGVDFRVDTETLAGKSREEVVEWMCHNQMARRNLTDIARSDLLGMMYNARKAQVPNPEGAGGKSGKIVGGQNDHQQKTCQQIADETGVSEKTVRRAGELADSLDKIAESGIDRSEFTNGKRKIQKGAIVALGKIAKADPEKAKRIWQKVDDQGPTSGAIKSAIREVENEDKAETIEATESDLVQIHLGDFRELSKDIPDESVDIIITDPPYPKEFLDTWDGLGEMASRILKPSGFCIAYSGKQHLDECIARVCSTDKMAFYWQVIFLQTVTPTIHPRKVNTKYKPILIFQKKPVKAAESYFVDVIEGDGVEKDGHEWQQSENGFAWLINTFTNVGDLIVEPFSGGGTCPAVASKLNRRCIAYEIDEKSHAASCERVFAP
jgi:hypothetical protein